MEHLTSVSALENPEEATALAAKILEPTPEAPTIEPPPSGAVELPGGLLLPDGTLHRNAEVRELTGADAEALTKAEVSKNIGRFMATLLQRGVVSIGTIEGPDKTVLNSLLIGDREMLFLAIRRATYGDELKFGVNCPACAENVDVILDLAKEVPVKRLEEASDRTFTVDLWKGGQMQVQLPTGYEQEAVLAAGLNRSPEELNTVLLSRCIYEPGASAPLGVPAVRALGMQDRKVLLDALVDRQPGPKYTDIEMECPACAHTFPLRIELMDLFR